MTFASQWQQFLLFTPRLVSALLMLLAFLVLGKLLARALSALLGKMSSARIHDSFFRTVIQLLFLYLGVVSALGVLGMEKLALSILAGGGVTAIVLGFAFREIGENLLAGVFLAFSRPFNIGDLINTEGMEGRVKAIELRYTHLRSADGRDIYVPSSQLFSKPVINYTRDGLRRFNFIVGIDYADDAAEACKLLLATIKQVSGILQKPAPGVTISSLQPQYVELTVYYWQDDFDKTIDGWQLRIDIIDNCRKALLTNNYTVSADTSSRVALSGSLDKV